MQPRSGAAAALSGAATAIFVVLQPFLLVLQPSVLLLKPSVLVLQPFLMVLQPLLLLLQICSSSLLLLQLHSGEGGINFLTLILQAGTASIFQPGKVIFASHPTPSSGSPSLSHHPNPPEVSD
jgi:hypothetical protein